MISFKSSAYGKKAKYVMLVDVSSLQTKKKKKINKITKKKKKKKKKKKVKHMLCTCVMYILSATHMADSV